MELAELAAQSPMEWQKRGDLVTRVQVLQSVREIGDGGLHDFGGLRARES